MKHKTIWLLIIMLLVVAGCSDKGKEPEPVTYRLVVGPPLWDRLHNPDLASFYIYDTDADTLIDSVMVCGPTNVEGSSESPYVSVLCERSEVTGIACNRIVDVRTQSVVGENCEGGLSFFDPGDNLLVSYYTLDGVHYNLITVASLPGGATVYIDTLFTPAQLDSADIRRIQLDFGQIDPEANLLYGLLIYGQEKAYGTDFFAYDYMQRRLHRVWRIRPEGPESWALDITRFQIHPDGHRVFFVSTVPEWGRWRLICYDLEDEEVLFTAPAHARLTYLQLTPDGSEIWLTTAGGFCIPPMYTNIAIHDTDDGTLIAEIPFDTLGVPGLYTGAYPKQIRFVPGMSKAYVADGEFFCGGYPPRVMVINTASYTVEEFIDHEFGLVSGHLQMAVVPAN